jgi:acyl-CoA hydrolase
VSIATISTANTSMTVTISVHDRSAASRHQYAALRFMVLPVPPKPQPVQDEPECAADSDEGIKVHAVRVAP